MKNRILRSLLFTMIILCAACSSKDEDPGPNDKGVLPGEFFNCRIIRIDRDGFDPTLYTYDDQGRLEFSSFSGYTAEYSYGVNQVTGKFFSDGDLTKTETVDLNDAGLAVRVEVDYVNESLKTTYSDFEYDSQHHLLKRTNSREGSTSVNHIVYQWVDGNMVAESKPDGSQMTTYTYSNNSVQPADWFNTHALAIGYYTIRNKNMVSTITLSSGDVFEHSYSADETGRFNAMHVNPSGSASYTNAFTYECD
jgi:hypothetical protein